MKLRNLLIGLGLLSGVAFAQETKESEDCLDAQSIVYTAIQSRDWNFAIEQSMVALKECPAKKGIYQNLIYALNQKYYYAATNDAKIQAADSIIMYYDEMLAKTGIDIDDEGDYASKLFFKNMDMNRVDTMFTKYINAKKEASYILYPTNYYSNLYNMFKAEKDEAKKLELKTRILEDYSRLNEYLDKSGMEGKDTYKSFYSGIFLNVAQKCEDILPVVKNKLATMPDDKEEKRKIVEAYMQLLESKSCQTSEEYAALLKISVEELDPTASTKMSYGDYLFENGKRSEGIEVMKEAVAMETDAEKKSNMTYRIVQRIYNMGNYKGAFSLADNVTGSDKGDAYVIKAKCVAATWDKCGVSTFERKAAFWLALDMLDKASAAGASTSSLKSKYCGNAPDSDLAWENGYKSGDPIKIGYWNMSSTVRFCN